MPVYQLDTYHMAFPPPDDANEDGLLAIGGALREDWLLMAYQNGIFPWFNEGDPILWWSPDPRFILEPNQVHIQKSMRKYLVDGQYTFTLDLAFSEVIDRCAEIPRKGQNGTWITRHMKEAYRKLHEEGMAHSAEVWEGDLLVGGVYGVSIGGVFFGESMFSERPNASKFALIKLAQWLDERNFHFIDCQIYSKHLENLGAQLIPRTEFLEMLDVAMDEPTILGKWNV